MSELLGCRIQYQYAFIGPYPNQAFFIGKKNIYAIGDHTVFCAQPGSELGDREVFF
jgi:hypothetical protein